MLSVFSLQNVVRFIILTYLVPVLFTFYIQVVPKFKKKSGAKRLNGWRFDTIKCVIHLVIPPFNVKRDPNYNINGNVIHISYYDCIQPEDCFIAETCC